MSWLQSIFDALRGRVPESTVMRVEKLQAELNKLDAQVPDKISPDAGASGEHGKP